MVAASAILVDTVSALEAIEDIENGFGATADKAAESAAGHKPRDGWTSLVGTVMLFGVLGGALYYGHAKGVIDLTATLGGGGARNTPPSSSSASASSSSSSSARDGEC